MRVILLGVGSSAGTPVIGCHCETCLSPDARNRRTRASAALIMESGEVILIDTSPDLRQQALRENLSRVDAVLYTHTHADHLHGIDDLRSFCQMGQHPIPLYGSRSHLETIAHRFAYAVCNPERNWDLPILTLHPMQGPGNVCGVKVIPIPARHGSSSVYGYRIGKFAYLTDVSEIPESSLALLQGLDAMVLDCLRYVPHHTHIGLEQSLDYAQRIGAKTTYLTHMTHDIEYHQLSLQLPATVHVGHDGLNIEIES